MKHLVRQIINLFKKRVKSYHFDWDDNVIKMPTKIIYFLKNEAAQTPKELKISTSFFADTRETVGKKDHVVNYRLKKGVAVQDEQGAHSLNLNDYHWIKEDDLSFREFRDHDTENFFVEDLKEAIENKSYAPSFNDFVEALECPKTAQRVTIITARGQSPQTIFEAVSYLKEIGVVQNLIPLENIYPVSYVNLAPEFKGEDFNPSDAKRRVLEKMINNLSEQSEKASVGFSDDDKKTFAVMKDYFAEKKKQGKWPNVDVHLYFTGNKTKEKHTL